MRESKRGNYKNSQEYLKLQSEITRLNNKLQELYEKKRKIKLYYDKSSKINKIFLIIAVSFEILAIILSKGLLLLVQSFVVAGVSLIGFDTSNKIYKEEKKLKASKKEIDDEIESTEAELKIARGNLKKYVQEKEKEMNNSDNLGRNKVLSNNDNLDYYNENTESHVRVKTLDKNEGEKGE